MKKPIIIRIKTDLSNVKTKLAFLFEIMDTSAKFSSFAGHDGMCVWCGIKIPSGTEGGK